MIIRNSTGFKFVCLAVLCISLVASYGISVYAGDENSDPVSEKTEPPVNQSDTVLKPDKEWKVKNSIFFLPNEVVAMIEARKGIIKSEESYADKPADNGERYITLSGIYYVDKNNWVIWLNGKKITPENIPEEIIELDVHKDYINIKWHDVAFQRVVVFTMKARQRFHLDTGMLLPG